MRRAGYIIALSAVVVACGASQANHEGGTDGGHEGSSSCTPGEQITCPCSGGGHGTMVCNAEGTAYGPCHCPDGGKDAGHDATMRDSGPGDSGVDVKDSTVRDAPGDTGHDGGADSGHEGSVEAGDGGCDCRMDGGIDAPTDTGVKDTSTEDVPPDVAPEVGSDAPSDGMCSLPTDAGTGDAGALNWASMFGVTGATDGTVVAIAHSSGDVALGGYFTGSIDFGGGVVSGGDAGGGAFLAKFDSAGTYKWAHIFATALGVEVYGVAIDSSGNVGVGGMMSGPTDFGGGVLTPTGDEDIFLAKYTSAGSFLWAEHFGVASQFCFFRQAAFDGSGNMYVVGEPGGNAVDLGCGALPSGMAMFVAEFDSGGSCVWSKAFGSQTQLEVLAIDPKGNVLVSGGFFGSINFGSGGMSAPGADLDVFIAKFTASGTLVWAKSYDSGASAEGTGIGADACGNILVAGDFSGTLNLGSGSMSAATDSLFVAKLDPSGAGIWSNDYVPTGSVLSMKGLAVDGLGGPAITGGFSNAIDFGGGSMSGAGSPFASTYIAKFSSAGSYEWAYAGGPPASTATNSAGEGIAANASTIAATGVFKGGTLSLDGTSMTAVTSQNTYLASFTR